MTFTLDFFSNTWRSALGRAEQVQPIIVCGLSTSRFACYRVPSSRGVARFGCPRGYYSVVLTVVDSQPFASCTCLGAFNGRLCYHIASAVRFHSSLVISGHRLALSDIVFRGVVSTGHHAPFFFTLSKKGSGEKSFLFSPFKTKAIILENLFSLTLLSSLKLQNNFVCADFP